MSTPAASPASVPVGFFRRLVLSALSRGATYLVLGAAILSLDLLTGRFLQFPILFIVPVGLSAWYHGPRLAYYLAFLLPTGRLLIAGLVEIESPIPSILVNWLVRVVVLALLAYLAGRTARQTRVLQQRFDTMVTICAWSRTVEYRGEWISFEQYLLRRFNIKTTHGISAAEAERAFGYFERDHHDE
jgi:hypothetical protein